MKADYLSYRIAASRAVLGLVIQVVLGLMLLVYGLEGRDPAAVTASIFVLIGMVAWLALAIVFDQHRRERIEAAEAEAFAASDSAGSSVFEAQSAELRVAARRLAMLHRWMLPAVSLVIGATLVGLGILRFRSGQASLSQDTFVAPPQQGWAIGLGLGLAFVGFLFARYISGMAKHPAWANLRGGAAYAVGSALMGLAMAVAHFVDIAGPDTIVRYLPVAFAAAMVALGAEIFLNFLLDLYRPRKPGEYGRPAFDSRILGFAAAPDKIAQSIGEAINYQFGYEVSESWFYRLLERAWWKLALMGVGVVWVMSAFAVIRPHERALVLRFGALSREIGPGPHLKWPWPIETISVPEFIRRDAQGNVEFQARTVTGIRTVHVGTSPAKGDGPILWTNEHHLEETFTLVQPDPPMTITTAGRASRASGAAAQASSDLVLVALEVPMHFAIRDLATYEKLGPPGLRDDLLRAVAQREMMLHVSAMQLGQVLAGNRSDLSSTLAARIQRAFDGMNPDADGKPMGAGVEILFVGVEGVHPPQRELVARSFEQVVEAEQKYRTKLDDARAEAIRTLTTSVGSVELAGKIAAEIDARDRMQKEGAAPEALAQQQARIRELIEQAGGRAAVIILEASAERWARQLGERARMLAYRGQLNTFRAAPDLFRATLYFDALRRAMADARVLVVDPFPTLHIRQELLDRETGQDVFTAQTQPQQPE